MVGFAKIEKAALKRVGQEELDHRFKRHIPALKKMAGPKRPASPSPVSP